MLRTIVASIALSMSGLAYAEPSAVIRELIDRKASALDFGLMRLEQAMPKEVPLASVGGRNWPLNFNATYDWNTDRIVLTTFPMVETLGPKPGKSDRASAKAACREAINYIRYLLGVDVTTGKLLPDRPDLAFYMRPKSFDYANERKDFASSLDAITVIRSAVTINRDMTPLFQVPCEAPYLGTTVLFPE